ncbi:MAG TPA: diacylglycerol kinase family protein [Thermoanaerobaculia bacterium]|nr:diacylglycerol kinase family protein [Thermoanaerobaculia bacterium]
MKPRRVLAIINSEGGTVRRGDFDAATIQGMFREAGVEADVRFVPGDQVDATASEAVRSGADAVIAGGGDGTIRCVASHLAGRSIPLGVLPLGTLNHFARDLGIPVEIPDAVKVIAEGETRSIDVGEVNGEVFVNNSVLGIYPPVVQQRDREREELDRNKWVATLTAALKVLPRNPLLRVRIRAEGMDVERHTRFLFVGNNEYEMNAFTYSARSREPDGTFHLYVARTRGRLGMVGLLFLGLVRDLKTTELVDCWTLPELTIETRERSVPVYLDGEVIVLESPLRYRTRPGALRVLAPRQ